MIFLGASNSVRLKRVCEIEYYSCEPNADLANGNTNYTLNLMIQNHIVQIHIFDVDVLAPSELTKLLLNLNVRYSYVETPELQHLGLR